MQTGSPVVWGAVIFMLSILSVLKALVYLWMGPPCLGAGPQRCKLLRRLTGVAMATDGTNSACLHPLASQGTILPSPGAAFKSRGVLLVESPSFNLLMQIDALSLCLLSCLISIC